MSTKARGSRGSSRKITISSSRHEQSLVKPPEQRASYDPRTGILIEQRPSGEIRIEVDVAGGIRAVELSAAQGQEVFNFLKQRFT